MLERFPLFSAINQIAFHSAPPASETPSPPPPSPPCSPGPLSSRGPHLRAARARAPSRPHGSASQPGRAATVAAITALPERKAWRQKTNHAWRAALAVIGGMLVLLLAIYGAATAMYFHQQSQLPPPPPPKSGWGFGR